MARQEELIRDDDSAKAPDRDGAQTSNQTGLRSSARKPSNTGPDSHSEHVAPVDGAFGNEEKLDERDNTGYLRDQAPKDKAR